MTNKTAVHSWQCWAWQQVHTHTPQVSTHKAQQHVHPHQSLGLGADSLKKPCAACNEAGSCTEVPADLPLYGHYVFIQATAAVAHVSKVTEDECPIDIKPTGNDVFTVLPGKAL